MIPPNAMDGLRGLRVDWSLFRRADDEISDLTSTDPARPEGESGIGDAVLSLGVEDLESWIDGMDRRESRFE